jgi:hypothetical protein
VFKDAEATEHAKVSGNAVITGRARIFDSAEAYDEAEISDWSEVKGKASVYGNAVFVGETEVNGNDYNGKIEYSRAAKEIFDKLIKEVDSRLSRCGSFSKSNPKEWRLMIYYTIMGPVAAHNAGPSGLGRYGTALAMMDGCTFPRGLFDSLIPGSEDYLLQFVLLVEPFLKLSLFAKTLLAAIQVVNYLNTIRQVGSSVNIRVDMDNRLDKKLECYRQGKDC